MTLAILATLISAAYFVSSKLVLARGMRWTDLWCWSLTTCGVVGLVTWLAVGAPPVAWGWCLVAGLTCAAAHVASNQAMAWGDASLLVPVSGAKPLALIVIAPLFSGTPLAPPVMKGSLLATFGIAMIGLAPRRVHAHARRPNTAFALMFGAVGLMALSDLCGNQAQRRSESMIGAFGCINLCFGLIPAYTTLRWRRPRTLAKMLPACGVGLLFTAFVAALLAAFAAAPDQSQAVASVNVVIACRGIVGIAMVMALDRCFATRLEPLPWWIHAARAGGAAVLAGAVWVACS